MSTTVLNPDGQLTVPGYTLIPNGGKVFYVHATYQSLSDLPSGLDDQCFTSINAALAATRANRGDVISVLQGHTESISAANGWGNIKAGVTIKGEGYSTERPVITWTAALSSLLLSAANVKIQNMQLRLAGAHAAGSALTVAAPITVSAAGVGIEDCEISWGFDADQIVGIGITTTAAADFFAFNRNECYAETAAVPTTTFLRLTGADFFECRDTRVIGPGSTVAIGPVQQLTTASLKVDIRNSVFQNTLAASTHAFTAIAGCTGTMHLCSLGVLAAGNGITTGSGIQVTGTYVAVAGAAGTLATG